MGTGVRRGVDERDVIAAVLWVIGAVLFTGLAAVFFLWWDELNGWRRPTMPEADRVARWVMVGLCGAMGVFFWARFVLALRGLGRGEGCGL